MVFRFSLVIMAMLSSYEVQHDSKVGGLFLIRPLSNAEISFLSVMSK